jgi:integrase/recombinase XerC
MEKNNNYHTEMNIKNTIKIKGVIIYSPTISANSFFVESKTLHHLEQKLPMLMIFECFLNSCTIIILIVLRLNIVDYPISILDYITREDIEEYMEHCSYYKKDDKEFTNGERGKVTKTSVITKLL